MDFVATCAKHLERLLAEELAELGVTGPEVTTGAVRFCGSYEQGMRALLGSRLASRLLIPVASLPGDPDGLYHAATELPYRDWLPPGATFAISAVGRPPEGHSPRFVALRLKDALVDTLRDSRGRRPDVNRDHPDVRFHLYLSDAAAQLSVDLSGAGLHRRGYRPKGAAAPLKESLAAAVLRIAGWPTAAAEGAPLVDPMCGSGTLLVEAALMARAVAPGLTRRFHACRGFAGHDPAAFDRVMNELRERAAAGRAREPVLVGYDASARSLALCRRAARAANVRLRLERRELKDASPPEDLPPGLVVTNPPYGQRLGDARELVLLYETLGDTLKRRFPGYRAFVLTGEPSLGKRLGLKPARRHPLFNGDLECRLLDVPISARAPTTDKRPRWRDPSPESSDYAGRLRKNVKRLRRWAKREGVEAYRVYDRDVPEYNVAIDLYGERALVSEYAPPRSVDPGKAERHLRDVVLLTPELLGLDPGRVHLRVRKRQTEGGQYARRAEDPERVEVRESGLRFWVDLRGHLDAGLFLDHRLVRRRIRGEARGKRFLNLYAYTCTASVYAAAGGAASTVSVDLSSNYLEWGKDNFALNGLAFRGHRFVDADCFEFLSRERGRFDLALVNPPSYSRSRRVAGDFDVVRDHARLLSRTLRLMAPGGTLYFSTHAKGFELNRSRLRGVQVDELTERLTPTDFSRSAPRIYRLRVP